MRVDAHDLVYNDHHAVHMRLDEHLRVGGSVMAKIAHRILWCEDHCVDDFAANFSQRGFEMLFSNPNDALEFKLRWY